MPFQSRQVFGRDPRARTGSKVSFDTACCFSARHLLPRMLRMSHPCWIWELACKVRCQSLGHRLGKDQEGLSKLQEPPEKLQALSRPYGWQKGTHEPCAKTQAQKLGTKHRLCQASVVDKKRGTVQGQELSLWMCSLHRNERFHDPATDHPWTALWFQAADSSGGACEPSTWPGLLPKLLRRLKTSRTRSSSTSSAH